MPKSEPIARIICDGSVNASIVRDDDTLYYATKNELFAIDLGNATSEEGTEHPTRH